MTVTYSTSLTDLFFAQSQRLGDKPFLWGKSNGFYQAISWIQADKHVKRRAHTLRQLGIEKGDRVMLLCENRPDWPICDLAIMAAGGISVPAYTTNSIADHRHVIANTTPKIAIVSGQSLAARLKEACAPLPLPPLIISIDPVERLDRIDDIALSSHRHDTCPTTPDIDDIACIIHSSGSSGPPKGVMLSHRAILHNCRGAYDLLQEIGLGEEVFLSFLPLSHAYEHTAGLYFPIFIGAQIYYAESIDSLSNALQEARPTIMTAVPRLYEVMRGKMLKTIERTGGMKAKLFKDAVRLGSLAYENPSALSIFDRLYNRALDRLVRRAIKARFGGRLKAMISGGAPLSYEIGLFFTALGVRILQGYGQTESAPVISCNRPANIRLATVGQALKDVAIKIAEDGEILVKGDLLMRGYWNDPAATQSTIDRQGWLHTGDIGHLDQDGFLTITDRKKDIIVTSGGENIAPQRLESLLASVPEISQAMIYGDRKPHLSAVIVPDESWSRITAESEKIAALSVVIATLNQNLSASEKIRKFIIADQAFTIENGLLTPTLKLRRQRIQEIYRDRLEEIYRRP